MSELLSLSFRRLRFLLSLRIQLLGRHSGLLVLCSLTATLLILQRNKRFAQNTNVNEPAAQEQELPHLFESRYHALVSLS